MRISPFAHVVEQAGDESVAFAQGPTTGIHALIGQHQIPVVRLVRPLIGKSPKGHDLPHGNGSTTHQRFLAIALGPTWAVVIVPGSLIPAGGHQNARVKILRVGAARCGAAVPDEVARLQVACPNLVDDRRRFPDLDFHLLDLILSKVNPVFHAIWRVVYLEGAGFGVGNHGYGTPVAGDDDEALVVIDDVEERLISVFHGIRFPDSAGQGRRNSRRLVGLFCVGIFNLNFVLAGCHSLCGLQINGVRVLRSGIGWGHAVVGVTARHQNQRADTGHEFRSAERGHSQARLPAAGGGGGGVLGGS